MIDTKDPEIHFTFTPDGQMTIEVMNVKGPECLQLTAPFMKAFEGAHEIIKKQEFHERETERLKQSV